MNTFVDNVMLYATSSGTGPFALGTAVAGFAGLAALQDGDSYSYVVSQGSNWEVGTGQFTASSNTLTRVVKTSSAAGAPVAFDVNAQVGFTFTAEDIAALVLGSGTTGATAKAAFNAYGLQWGVWFNATPGASELLALYTSPIIFQYPVNFAGAQASPPLTNPAAAFVLSIEQRLAGEFQWTEVGTATIGVDGGMALATTGGAVVSVGVGDQLRVLAPPGVDADVAGFSMTFKGIIP